MQKIVLSIGLFLSLAIANQTPKVITDNGCLSCHSIMGQSQNAPSFGGIARKNSRWYGESAKEKIMSSIATGSVGKYPRFKSMKMPAYPNLSKAELDEIAAWILVQKAPKGRGNGNMDGNGGMRGMRGI